MKRFRRIGLVVAALGFGLSMAWSPIAGAQPSAKHKGLQVKDRIIVKFKKDVSASKISSLHKKEESTVESKNKSLGFQVVKVHGQSAQQAIKDYNKMPDVEYAEPVIKYKAFWTPNDPLYASDQYGPQKMQVPAAWDVTKGSSDVKVAVVDTGVQFDHPDLKGQILQGYDFVDNDNDAKDEQGHGTHVSGTVAALTDNGVGVAGVAPNVKVLAVRVLDENGSGTNEGVAKGITYAADQGAKVISLSLGGSSPSKTLEDSVNYAWNKGAVVVCAAGNSGNTSPNYPAYYEKAIAVAATNADDKKASFSTYGTWVDVAAPGENIISTVLGGGYDKYSGTSMATPHASGVAALLASQGRSNTEIRSTLESTADKITGTGDYWVHGRLNAAKAVGAGGGDPDPDPQDTFEPNNSLATSHGPLTSGTVYNSKIFSETDEDWYKIKTSSTGTIAVNLSNVPADYDLYLYNSSGNLLSYSWNSGTSNESISTRRAAGTYYIKVVGWDGAHSTTSNYALKATFK
ncbi:thermitase [Marininema mesophilum]|uniref:Thermitase n=1 Tax=Marininema mesophilum TaxID=1048340 RepID=A0A1H3ATW6_9BACL|nr:S8 family serine peptidase [Marininema mesophilum]SDX32868.1 thermitase [Marininema mesophilum]